MIIKNKLEHYRHKAGFSVSEFAEKSEVTKTTIHAIENGNRAPNTGIALRMAYVLGVNVHDLFQIDCEDAPPAMMKTAELLPPSDEEAHPGLPLQVCEVGRKLVAVPPAPFALEMPPADAVLIKQRKMGGVKIQILNSEDERTFSKRILIAGCDPGISVLLRQLRREDVTAVAAQRNSTESLNLLKQSLVHVAGTHLRDEETGEFNLHAVREQFPEGSVAVFSYALWDEGIVTARGNPKGISGIEDFAREDITIVNREPGSGTRMILDTYLKKHGISAPSVKGYETVALGHIPAASQVKNGAADCCLTIKTVACILGLDFIPLGRERYDLVIHKHDMNHHGVKVLLDSLNHAAFRRELECLGGYDTSVAGDRVM